MTNNILFAIIVIPLFIAGCIYFDWSIDNQWKKHKSDCTYSDPDKRIGHDGDEPEWKE